MNLVLQRYWQINIIIDDGSHNGERQRFSFETLEQYLPSGGIYVIEDVKSHNIEPFKTLSIFSSPEKIRYIRENYRIQIFDTRKDTNKPDDILICFIKN